MSTNLVPLALDKHLWDQAFTVAPLVVVGTREENGSWDLAPKHLAMPASWQNHFVFVCTPAHATYGNILREGTFTVTYVRPKQVLLASLAAAPRCDSGEKRELSLIPTFPAPDGNGIFVEDGYLFLSCKLQQMVDNLGTNSLIIGEVTGAWVATSARRDSESDDAEILHENPVPAYLHPGRYVEIARTQAFPFAQGFKR
jgi:flavin reductase (DIM6/NTAB) family NADH-FMN oxidoreductase RutF